MNLLHALRDRLRRYPRPDDAAGIRQMTSAQWAGIAKRTPTYLDAYVDRPGSTDRGQRRAEWLAARGVFGEASSVIELGCGAGRNLAALLRRRPGLSVGGFDVNEDAIALARTTVPAAHFMVMDLHDLERWPYDGHPDDALVDVVLAHGVLGHLEPTIIPKILHFMLTAHQAAVIVDEAGAGVSRVLKGPRRWRPVSNTGDYVLWAHPITEWLVEAGVEFGMEALPPDLQAPAARMIWTVDTTTRSAR